MPKFLLFPKEINNEVRWLETASWREELVEARWVDNADRWIGDDQKSYVHPYWKPTNFINYENVRNTKRKF